MIKPHIKALKVDSNLLKIFSNITPSNILVSGNRYSFSSINNDIPKLSKNNQSKLKKCENKLSRLDAEYIWVKKEEYKNYWELMKNFHKTRWNKKGKQGAFFDQKFDDFHTAFRLDNPQEIKISAILVNNSPIAIHYYFTSGETLYFYQSGWDEENYAKVSPGFALHIWSMIHSAEKNYDFMMGNANKSYKANLGCNRNSTMYNIVLTKNKLKTLLKKIINKF